MTMSFFQRTTFKSVVSGLQTFEGKKNFTSRYSSFGPYNKKIEKITVSVFPWPDSDNNTEALFVEILAKDGTKNYLTYRLPKRTQGSQRLTDKEREALDLFEKKGVPSYRLDLGISSVRKDLCYFAGIPESSASESLLPFIALHSTESNEDSEFGHLLHEEICRNLETRNYGFSIEPLLSALHIDHLIQKHPTYRIRLVKDGYHVSADNQWVKLNPENHQLSSVNASDFPQGLDFDDAATKLFEKITRGASRGTPVSFVQMMSLLGINFEDHYENLSIKEGLERSDLLKNHGELLKALLVGYAMETQAPFAIEFVKKFCTPESDITSRVIPSPRLERTLDFEIARGRENGSVIEYLMILRLRMQLKLSPAKPQASASAAQAAISSEDQERKRKIAEAREFLRVNPHFPAKHLLLFWLDSIEPKKRRAPTLLERIDEWLEQNPPHEHGFTHAFASRLEEALSKHEIAFIEDCIAKLFKTQPDCSDELNSFYALSNEMIGVLVDLGLFYSEGHVRYQCVPDKPIEALSTLIHYWLNRLEEKRRVVTMRGSYWPTEGVPVMNHHSAYELSNEAFRDHEPLYTCSLDALTGFLHGLQEQLKRGREISKIRAYIYSCLKTYRLEHKFSREPKHGSLGKYMALYLRERGWEEFPHRWDEADCIQAYDEMRNNWASWCSQQRKNRWDFWTLGLLFSSDKALVGGLLPADEKTIEAFFSRPSFSAQWAELQECEASRVASETRWATERKSFTENAERLKAAAKIAATAAAELLTKTEGAELIKEALTLGAHAEGLATEAAEMMSSSDQSAELKAANDMATEAASIAKEASRKAKEKSTVLIAHFKREVENLRDKAAQQLKEITGIALIAQGQDLIDRMSLVRARAESLAIKARRIIDFSGDTPELQEVKHIASAANLFAENAEEKAAEAKRNAEEEERKKIERIEDLRKRSEELKAAAETAATEAKALRFANQNPDLIEKARSLEAHAKSLLERATQIMEITQADKEFQEVNQLATQAKALSEAALRIVRMEETMRAVDMELEEKKLATSHTLAYKARLAAYIHLVLRRISLMENDANPDELQHINSFFFNNIDTQGFIPDHVNILKKAVLHGAQEPLNSLLATLNSEIESARAEKLAEELAEKQRIEATIKEAEEIRRAAIARLAEEARKLKAEAEKLDQAVKKLKKEEPIPEIRSLKARAKSLLEKANDIITTSGEIDELKEVKAIAVGAKQIIEEARDKLVEKLTAQVTSLSTRAETIKSNIGELIAEAGKAKTDDIQTQKFLIEDLEDKIEMARRWVITPSEDFPECAEPKRIVEEAIEIAKIAISGAKEKIRVAIDTFTQEAKKTLEEARVLAQAAGKLNEQDQDLIEQARSLQERAEALVKKADDIIASSEKVDELQKVKDIATEARGIVEKAAKKAQATEAAAVEKKIAEEAASIAARALARGVGLYPTVPNTFQENGTSAHASASAATSTTPHYTFEELGAADRSFYAKAFGEESDLDAEQKSALVRFLKEASVNELHVIEPAIQGFIAQCKKSKDKAGIDGAIEALQKEIGGWLANKPRFPHFSQPASSAVIKFVLLIAREKIKSLREEQEKAARAKAEAAAAEKARVATATREAQAAARSSTLFAPAAVASASSSGVSETAHYYVLNEEHRAFYVKAFGDQSSLTHEEKSALVTFLNGEEGPSRWITLVIKNFVETTYSRKKALEGVIEKELDSLIPKIRENHSGANPLKGFSPKACNAVIKFVRLIAREKKEAHLLSKEEAVALAELCSKAKAKGADKIFSEAVEKLIAGLTRQAKHKKDTDLERGHFTFKTDLITRPEIGAAIEQLGRNPLCPALAMQALRKILAAIVNDQDRNNSPIQDEAQLHQFTCYALSGPDKEKYEVYFEIFENKAGSAFSEQERRQLLDFLKAGDQTLNLITTKIKDVLEMIATPHQPDEIRKLRDDLKVALETDKKTEKAAKPLKEQAFETLIRFVNLMVEKRLSAPEAQAMAVAPAAAAAVASRLRL